MIEITDQGVLLTPTGVEDRLAELGAAVRELAHLRVAERELPARIEAAVARADAACEALGLAPDSAALALLSPPGVVLGDESGRLAAGAAPIAPACRVCLCTDLQACEGGCCWVPDPMLLGPLCSRCLPLVEQQAQPDAGPTAGETSSASEEVSAAAGEPESDPEGDPPPSGDDDESAGELRRCESCGVEVPWSVPGDSEGVVECEACAGTSDPPIDYEAEARALEALPDFNEPPLAAAGAGVPAEEVEPDDGPQTVVPGPSSPMPEPEARGGRPLGECARAILEVLERAAPAQALASEISNISGYDVAQVRQTLRRLVESGRVERDDMGHFPLFRLAQSEPTPLASALMDAAGVDPRDA